MNKAKELNKLHNFNKIYEADSKPDIFKDNQGDTYIVYSNDYIYFQKLADTSQKYRLTKDKKIIRDIKGVCDSREVIWIVFSEYIDGLKQLKLLTVTQNIPGYIMNITKEYGKIANPFVEIRTNELWIAWESHGVDGYRIKCIVIDTVTQSIIYEAEPSSLFLKAYKPLLITADDGKLYIFYEVFSENRYRIICQSINADSDSDSYLFSFSNPVEIGCSECNDMELSACKYGDSILYAWENSRPIKKGYIWNNGSDRIEMPADGHGWRIETNIHIGHISCNMNKWTNGLLGKFNSRQKSSGCPKILTDSNGTIILTYLEFEKRAWEIKFKYYDSDGDNWNDMETSHIFVHERLTPSILNLMNTSDIVAMYDSNKEDAKYYHISKFKLNLPENINTKKHKFEFKQKIPLCITFEDNKKTVNKQTGNIHKRHELIIKKNDKKNDKNDNEVYKVWWGDLHMHTNFSPCSRHADFHCTEINDKYRYSKDVGGLDFAMITDHAENMNNNDWIKTKEAAYISNIPFSFVTFIGFEWTSSTTLEPEADGHYNVLYSDDGPKYSSRISDTNSIDKLWNKLDKNNTLTIPHHPGEAAHLTDWSHNNNDLTPLVEIFQVRGSYEYYNCPLDPDNFGRQNVPGHSVQDALNRGYIMGFTAGGEHEGVGITAVIATELTKQSIFEALKKRHTYGTTGARIKLLMKVDSNIMGDIIQSVETPTIEIEAEGTAPIESIRIIKDGINIKEWFDLAPEASLTWKDDSCRKGESHYYYAVIRQKDGEMAWGSPVFIR